MRELRTRSSHKVRCLLVACLTVQACNLERDDAALGPTHPSRFSPSIVAQSQNCSPRNSSAIPPENTGDARLNLPLQAYFPCYSKVSIIDPTNNPVVAQAVAALASAMGGGGLPEIGVNLSSADFSVNLTFGTGDGPWNGQVILNSDGRPAAISIGGSCTQSCGELYDVVLNELTQLYGLADGSQSKWDDLGGGEGIGITDHCAANGPARKAHLGTICQFEIQAVRWKYGLVSQAPFWPRHIATDISPPVIITLPPDGYSEPRDTLAPFALYVVRGNQDDPVRLVAPRPIFAYGNPSVGGCQSSSCDPSGVDGLLSYSWVIEETDPNAYFGQVGDRWPEVEAQSTLPQIDVPLWGTLAAIRLNLAEGTHTSFVSGFADPREYRFLGEPSTLNSIPPILSFGVESCTIVTYGNKSYASWRLSWIVNSDGPWEVVASPTNQITDGFVISSGSTGSGTTLPDLLLETSYHLFLRLPQELPVPSKALDSGALSSTQCDVGAAAE